MLNEAQALNLNTEQVELKVTTKEKGKGGRPVNPNSMTSRANALLASLTVEELKKDIAVPKLIAEIGCKESSAMTFFYTFKTLNSKKSNTTPDQV